MKKLLLSLAAMCLTTGYCIAQDKPYMTLTTSKQAGERIQFIIASDGGFTIEGVEETEGVEGYAGYTVTGPEIKLIGNIKEFSAPYVNITSADISNMPGITSFDVFGNPITEINLSNNQDLKTLVIGATEITSLDITKCTSLEMLNINSSNIASLDLSSSSNLVTVFAKAAGLEELNLTGAVMLDVLDCSYNKLGTLDISQAPSITQLSCAGNELSTLDLSSNRLIVLNCNVNNLTTLDLSSQDKLQEVGCVNNKLETVDFSNCKELFGAAVHGNMIFDKGMTALVESLPTVTGEAGYFTVVDYAAENERNEMSVTNVEKAAAKNWISYDYQGGTSGESYGTVYEGMPEELLSIDDVCESHLNVYKPAAGQNIYISGVAEESKITIYDISGKEIAVRYADHGVTIINLSAVPSGVYVVKSGTESVKVVIN